MQEILVGNGIGEGARIDVVGRTYTRHTDCVRSNAEAGLKVLGMHQHPNKVVRVGRQTEEDATAHIVDACRLGTVHGFGVPGIVALGTRGM